MVDDPHGLLADVLGACLAIALINLFLWPYFSKRQLFALDLVAWLVFGGLYVFG
jgi:hypothetical protein